MCLNIVKLSGNVSALVTWNIYFDMNFFYHADTGYQLFTVKCQLIYQLVVNDETVEF